MCIAKATHRYSIGVAAILTVITMALSACATTPQVVEVPREVQVVEKIEVVKEVENIVTPTPGPVEEYADASDVQVFTTTWARKWPAPSPLYAGGEHQTWTHVLYQPCFNLDEDLNLMPGYCQSFEGNENHTSYTVTLVEDAVWSDGTPITAQQVADWYNYITKPTADPPHERPQDVIGSVKGFKSVQSGDAEAIEGIVVIDEHTLRFDLEIPNRLFPFHLATKWAGVARADEAAADPEYFNKTPTSSGPFMLASHITEGGLTEMVKNPHWWGTEPMLEKIVIRNTGDDMASGLLFESGQVDDCWCGDDTIFPIIKRLGEDQVKIRSQHFPLYFELLFSVVTEPANDPKVREALVHSVDYETIVDAIIKPINPDLHGWIRGLNESLPCYTPEKSEFLTLDVERAKAALSESSYGSAEALPPIRITTNTTWPVMVNVVEAVIEQWRVNLGITNVQIVTSLEHLTSDETVALKRISAAFFIPDQANFMYSLWHSDSSQAQHPWMDGYKNENVDALIEEAQQLLPDNPRYCEALIEAEMDALSDYVILPLWIWPFASKSRAWVNNIRWNNQQQLYSIWTEPLTYISEH